MLSAMVPVVVSAMVPVVVPAVVPVVVLGVVIIVVSLNSVVSLVELDSSAWIPSVVVLSDELGRSAELQDVIAVNNIVISKTEIKSFFIKYSLYKFIDGISAVLSVHRSGLIPLALCPPRSRE